MHEINLNCKIDKKALQESLKNAFSDVNEMANFSLEIGSDGDLSYVMLLIEKIFNLFNDDFEYQVYIIGKIFDKFIELHGNTENPKYAAIIVKIKDIQPLIEKCNVL